MEFVEKGREEGRSEVMRGFGRGAMGEWVGVGPKNESVKRSGNGDCGGSEGMNRDCRVMYRTSGSGGDYE